MYKEDEAKVTQEIIAKLVDAVCVEQQLHKEADGDLVTLVDKLGNHVFDYDTKAVFTVTSFIKHFGDALKETLL